MTTIPASQLVQVVPSVLQAGGDSVDAIGLLLTSSTRVPLKGTNSPVVLSFPDAASVGTYFGGTSAEAIFAGGGLGLGAGYFGGFVNSTKLPGSLLIAQYNQSAVAAYVRGGRVSTLTLAQLQALSGTLSIIMDGYSRSGGTINLSAVTSFSNAATTIQTALNTGPATQASFTGSIAGTTLTVTALSSGTIAAGQTVVGTGVVLGTIITGQLSGSVGGTGTYTVSPTQAMSSSALTTTATVVTVAYDSVAGAFTITSGATGAASTVAFPTGTLVGGLALSSASGAVLSQGAAAASPAAFMNGVIAQTTNWVTYTTLFDPDGGSGNTVKQAFANWKNSALGGNRFAYVCWDTDITPTLSVPALTSLGQILEANADSGTCLIYEPTDLNLAAFVMGATAAINFNETNGRITFAYKSQAGLTASVTDGTVAQNLAGDPQSANEGNFYNFYGAYASANSNFTWFQRGFVTGTFEWFDSYINQIVMNSSFKAALLNMLGNVKSVPYSVAGNAIIETALADPINQFKAFGAFAPGNISASQIAEVNAQAGASIAGTLQTQGYYLQIKPATSVQRAARTSPPITFWYLDRGAVQAINMASIEVQ